jgi:hypothetical protein
MGAKEVQVAIPDLLWNPDVAADLDPSKETMRLPQGNMTQLKAAVRKLVGECSYEAV